jgi:putative endonuclease
MTEARRQRGSRAAATGVGAEAIAAQLLTAEGWVVLARRARTPAGEIDLIAYALGPHQRARLIAGAEAWLVANPGHGAAGMRFDVILVAGDGSVRRVADAFRIGDL